MALGSDLGIIVKGIFASQWTTRDGQVVPDPANLKLDSNDGVRLDATVLYADINGSTSLVDNYKPGFAGEVYKSYLECAARIIKSEGGVITSYDGDRIMAVFIGTQKSNNAVRAGLKINGAVFKIINPALKAQYPNESFVLKHIVGIDTSSVIASRIGVKNDNDLVWIGRAANYAAKLSEIPSDISATFITEAVYNDMDNSVKSYQGQGMWAWSNPINNFRILKSTWYFDV